VSTTRPPSEEESPHIAGTTQAETAEILADSPALAGSFGEWVSAYLKRLRQGESGVLPVVGGLVIIIIIFQLKKSVFLSAGNITALLQQGAAFVLLGMAEVFVLLLGEIDLSTGYVAAVGATITVAASTSHHLNWFLAILLGLAVTTAIGLIQGLLITLLKLPSFVVTLAGLLGWQGALIYLANREAGPNGGGVIRITDNVLNDLASTGNLSVAAGWIVAVVGVALFAGLLLFRDVRRRRSGLVTVPLALTIIKIAAVAVAVFVLVAICNTNRGHGFFPIRGVPWVVLIVIGLVAAWTFLLARTKFGRYVYAIGGNAEAARRAGVNLTRMRVACFALCSFTAGVAGIIYSSRLGSISSNVDGGQLVLYAVAAAVIGGTSLFGGRGKMVHALLGGLVIATIANGMGLIGLSAAAQYMVTALVLLAAVTVDALARRGATQRT
jgi:D-xylose transport system permease protein